MQKAKGQFICPSHSDPRLSIIVYVLRILRVPPDRTKSNLLRCKVKYAHVSSTYPCLSYVWG